MKLAIDISSTVWSCLLAGTDPEGYKVSFEDKEVTVNTAAYGYEFVINSIKAALDRRNMTPMDLVLVVEGMNSKAPRLMIDKNYKQGRGRPTESYQEFQKLRDEVVELFRSLGAVAVQQDNCESDDVLAWLAENIREDLDIESRDGDISVLNGINVHGAKITVSAQGESGINKYGLFPCKYISLYKAMVGDTGDKITGIHGFGKAKWLDFDREFGEDGMAEMVRLGELGNLEDLALEATQNKMVGRIYEGRADFIRSYKLAKLHPEWVNHFKDPLQWMPGFVHGVIADSRLKGWGAQMRLVTADNYSAALAFLKSKVAESKFYALDLETSTSDESDDWLAGQGKADGVDVIGSKITGGSISFGANGQYAYYISVDHADTNNVTLQQFAEMVTSLDPTKHTAAHNAAGFELPVMYNEISSFMQGNGWRGMYPNMVDTRIAASFWDENQFSHGLKQLSQKLFGYEQESYVSVTGGLKMNQITGERVLHYGCDDVYTSAGLWNFFKLFMELEGTLPSFLGDEQKPMYLQAMAYTRGIKLDMARLSELSAADVKLREELSVTVDSFLVANGWEGTVCPVYTELTPASIKEAVQIVLGLELKTMVRKVSSIARLVRGLEAENASILASFIATEDVESINKMVAAHFQGKPVINTGSPKQLQSLFYDTIKAPVRLRNKPTDLMRAKGVKEGTARTDEDAFKLAIRMGDIPDDIVPVVKALVEMKSITTRNGLYWEPYPKLLHHSTGKLHPSLRQSATNTRRFTGNSPNIQQMDSSYGGVRSVIVPHHKKALVVSLDESAQEVRQLADYCKDSNLLTCYLGTKDELRDVHSIVGSRIAGCEYQEFRLRLKAPETEKEYTAIRQSAKITLFASIYGATAPKIAEGLGITVEEAQAYLDAIYAQFPGIKTWKDECERFANVNGYVEIHGGTVRHLAPLLLSEDKYIASKAMRQAGNARIQAAGGTQIKRVMTRIWDSRLLDDYDYEWYFSVHDESLHSVGVKDIVEVTRQLHGFMTEQFLEVVPSASSIGFGKSFGTLVEIGEEFSEEKVLAAVEKILKPIETV